MLPSYASEIGGEIQSVEGDVEESWRLFRKDPRFVIVPNPVSNPTIGTGLALAGLYLHPQKESDSNGSQTSISGVMGIYTDSESWAVGVFHNGFYSGDRFRVRSLLGYGEFNLKYYGIGNDSILREHPIDYEAKATLFAPRVLFKLPLKNWLIGPEYFYLDIDTTFKLSRLHRILPDINIPTQTAGLGVVLVYDSRDNNLWPSKGVAFEATARDYGEYTGGDFDYEKFIIKLSQYFSLTESVIFAYRLDGQFVRGNDVPFYDLSRLRLRGLPSGSYIDNHALSAQGEVRWNFFGRWTALLFGGGGRIAEEIDDLASSQTHYAGGVGIRFMIAEKQKLNIGVDFTYADDKFEFYVQVGDWFAP